MKRVLSMLCVFAMLLGMITVPAFAQSVTDIRDNTVVLSENAENLTFGTDTYLDLGGYDVAGVTVEDGATLYVFDSRTDDYTVADGVYGKITEISGAVQAAEGYLAIAEEEAVSFHKVDLSLKSMALRPAVAGVYYNSSFAADEVVAANVEYYGVALSVVEAPTAENLETLCGYSVIPGFASGEKTGTLLTGIMEESNSAEQNAANAAMPVYGSAYIKTADGYTFGACVSRDLKTQVEAIDAVFDALTDTQKSGIQAMYGCYKAAMEDWNIPNLRASQLENTVITVPVDVADGKVTETVTVEENGMSITIPFGTLVEKTELTLTVTKLPTSESGIEAQEGQQLLPFDVHVEGVAAENTVPLTVSLGKVLPKNLNMGNYDAYHLEGNDANEMTLVANDREFTAHNQFKYTLEGELTLSMATFSVVTMSVDEDNAWKDGIDYSWYDASAAELEIRNADQLAGLNKLVSGDAGNIAQDSFENKTVKLLSDLNFEGSIWYPIGYWAPGEGTNSAGETEWYTYGGGFSGTFDGNGNTVANISQNTWALNGNYDYGYWDEAMGLFGYVVNGTVKNLTVKNFYSEGEFTPTGCVTAYACNSTFENIALVDCNPRVYNTGNGGIVGIGGNSGDTEDYNLTFNNITIDNSNKITALWGSWDVACGGLIGMFRGAGHVYMNNCHVAAQIDVYNDVCGNYQYYWYRYSGMLVGTNKNMTTDENGYTVPETDKFHASGCTVHFGTWNNYWYCELVANSLASYTHDHQFSRLTLISSIADIQDENGWTKTGNYLLIDGETKTCYHIVKDENGNLKQHLHEEAGYEDSIDEDGDGNVDLKEDKQIVYLPFNQLFTGYGWGVKHIPITDYPEDQVKILDREIADSVEKFDSLVAEGTEYTTGTTVTIGELFAAKADLDEKVAIQQGKVQVTVSPATEGSTAGGSYTPDAEDWTKGTLELTGYGTAKVTITDYYFCTPTELTLYVSIDKSDANALAMEMDFDKLKGADGVARAVCPACVADGDDSIKEWTALASTADGRNDNLSADHYYLAENLLENKGVYLGISNNKVCVNLNGHNVTNTDDRVFFAARTDAILTIMGEGVVTGNRSSIETANIAASTISARGNLNLYGGTYKSGKDTTLPVVLLASASKTFNIYEDVTIEGNEGQVGLTVAYGNAVVHAGTISSMEITGKDIGGQVAAATASLNGGTVTGHVSVGDSKNITLTISGNPVISDLDVTAGVLPTIGKLTEGADITIRANAVGDTVSKKLTAEGYEAYGKYFHATTDGWDVTVDGNVLKVAESYCPHCDQVEADIAWTDIDPEQYPSEKDYTTNLSEAGHYRLVRDIDADTNAIILSERKDTTERVDIVLDTKGYHITAGRRCFTVKPYYDFTVFDGAGGSEATSNWVSTSGTCGGIYIENNSTAKIYNLKMTGSKNTIESGACVRVGQSATLDIYSGEFCANNEDPQATGLSRATVYNQGTLNIYGGTIHESVLKDGTEISIYSTGSLNIAGGTLNGKVATANKDDAIILSGAPVIEELALKANHALTIGELTAGANINVNATGVFSGAVDTDTVKGYIDSGYIKAHSSLEGKVVAIVEGVLTITDASVEETPETGDGTENGDENTEPEPTDPEVTEPEA